MSPALAITGKVIGAEQVATRLLNAGPRVQERTRSEVQRLGLQLLTKVKADKLSGQVLNVRTGRLRRSINEKFTEAGLTFASSVGTNVTYGRAWELGFQGVQQVREHLRTVKQAFGRPIAPTQALVGAHSRKVNTPARPFLRPSLAEMKDEIRAGLMRAMKGGI